MRMIWLPLSAARHPGPVPELKADSIGKFGSSEVISTLATCSSSSHSYSERCSRICWFISQHFPPARHHLPRTPAIFVAPDAAKGITAAHGKAWPREACGFLLGDDRQKRPIVTEVVIARGLAGHRDAFEISDYELRRVRSYAEDNGLCIVALSHSHASGETRLSKGDRSAPRYSAWPWVIVTRSGPVMAITLSAYAAGNAAPRAIK